MEIALPPITTAAKSPETESDNPTRIQPAKPISFTNGVLKRHNNIIPVTPIVISYKECLKNHAAALGGHALDGCGEFMPSPTSTPSDPTSLKCAACGCHRNFHRREPEDNNNLLPAPLTSATHVIEYQPHHRHRPPPPLTRSPNSASPPPISSSYYPSAPHMLLALSTGLSENPNTLGQIISPVSGGGNSTRKRFRTKFSTEQKEKMFRFAERVGWKMQKRDEDVVHEFCNEIGVNKGVLKVWMHNNKNTFFKRDEGVLVSSNGGSTINNVSATLTANNTSTTHIGHHNQIHHDNMNGNNDNNNNTTSNEDEDEEEDDHPRQLPSHHHHHNGGGSSSNLGNIANNPNHHHYQVGRDHPHGGSSSS